MEKESPGGQNLQEAGIRKSNRMTTHKVIFPVLESKDHRQHLPLVGVVISLGRVKLAGGVIL